MRSVYFCSRAHKHPAPLLKSIAHHLISFSLTARPLELHKIPALSGSSLGATGTRATAGASAHLLMQTAQCHIKIVYTISQSCQGSTELMSCGLYLRLKKKKNPQVFTFSRVIVSFTLNYCVQCSIFRKRHIKLHAKNWWFCTFGRGWKKENRRFNLLTGAVRCCLWCHKGQISKSLCFSKHFLDNGGRKMS